jgi:catecholate siderophore receptor
VATAQSPASARRDDVAARDTARRPAAPRPDSARRLDAVVVREAARPRATYGARRATSATRTDLPLRDVPQAVTVVGRALIADLAMSSIADVVRWVPGVTMGQGEGHRDAPTIRGQASTADFFVDGVRDDAQYLRDVYNVERVETLKGANAMAFGRGGGGGVLNRVTKQAEWTPTRAATLEGGSRGQRRALVDLGDGDGSLAGRMNAMYERSTTFRAHARHERLGVNPTAAWLAGGTIVRAGYERFDDRRTVDRGIPSFQGRPADAPVSTFFGDPDASRSRVSMHSADLLVERGDAEGLLVRSHVRYGAYDKFYQNVYPGAVNAAGTQVSLSAYNSATDRHNLFNQTDLTLVRTTGRARHTLLAGAELGRQSTGNHRATGYFDGTRTSWPVELAHPTVQAPVAFRQSATDAENRVVADVASGWVQHQLALGPVQTIAGLRYDRFAVRFSNHRDGSTLERADGMLSPRAGLVVKPVEPLSLYGSWSVSHLPSSGDQFASLTATTRALEPERFMNRELGAKWEPREELSVTAAVYRLDRSNTAAPDPADPSRTVQTGRQRTTGAELGVTGRLTARWQMAGGWATQRATIVERTSAAKAGATVPLVPRQTLSLWNRVQLARRIGAGVGVVHQARSYAALDNTVTLPAFTRADAALFLTLRRELRAQLNVENVLDARYWATSHGNNNIMPGAPRTLRLSLTVAP